MLKVVSRIDTVETVLSSEVRKTLVGLYDGQGDGEKERKLDGLADGTLLYPILLSDGFGALACSAVLTITEGSDS